MTKRAVLETRMVVVALDWTMCRIERYHFLFAEFFLARRESGFDRASFYEFLRTLNREAGETVTGVLMMIDGARKMRAVHRERMAS